MATLTINHIVATPNVCGGKPRIEGTRMRVQDVALIYRGGSSVEWIVEQYELTPSQVHAALSYYYDHRDEIDRDIENSDAFARQFIAEGKAELASDLKKRVESRKKGRYGKEELS